MEENRVSIQELERRWAVSTQPFPEKNHVKTRQTCMKIISITKENMSNGKRKRDEIVCVSSQAGGQHTGRKEEVAMAVVRSGLP